MVFIGGVCRKRGEIVIELGPVSWSVVREKLESIRKIAEKAAERWGASSAAFYVEAGERMEVVRELRVGRKVRRKKVLISWKRLVIRW